MTRFVVILAALAWPAGAALAQYGLSGAPEILPLGSPHRAGGIHPAGYEGTWGQPAADSGWPSAAATAPAPALQPPLANPAGSYPPPPAYPSGPTAYPSAPMTPAANYPAAANPAVARPAATSVMQSMLAELPSGNAPPPGPMANPGGPMGWSCGPAQAGTVWGPAQCCPDPATWYVAGAGLALSRDDSNSLHTSYEDGNNPNQFPRPRHFDWNGGWEFKIGRRFACGQWAVEADYWANEAMRGDWRFVIPGGAVSTPLIVSDIEFDGVNGTVLFDGAAEHRVWRQSDVQNIELNLLRARLANACDSNWDVGVLAGVRYFRFNDDFLFASLQSGGTWGGDGSDEAYLHERIENHLVGGQIGAEAAYRLGRTVRLVAAPKLGIFNNHTRSQFDLYRGDGVLATPTAASGVVGTYPVRSSDDSFSMLGQIDLTAEWEFCPNWTAFVGYRLVGATGIGLADNQIPIYVVDIPEIARIDTNGSLIVHGAMVGLKVAF